MRAERWIGLPLYAVVAAGLLSGCAAQKQVPAAEIEVVSIETSTETSSLQEQLDEANKEVAGLKAEIDHLRVREADLTTQLKQALRTAPGKTISDRKETASSAPESAASIKQLQDEIKRERTKRQQLEQQLAKLKVETSSPPIPVEVAAPQPIPHVEDAEPAPEPAPQVPPVAHVVEEPAPEPPKVAHVEPPVSEPLHAIPEPTGGTAGEVSALKARSVEQETKHQDAIASLAHALDADRIRQEDLEAQLVALRGGAPGSEGAVAADSNEVNHLRTRLEEERRRNAELTAKLKLAGRVTDLVFRMQQPGGSVAAGSAAPVAPPAPAAPAWPRYSQRDEMPNPSAPNQPYMDGEGNVHQPDAPRVRDVAPPAEVNSERLEVPAVEVPPVFEDEGPNVVEETTQD